MSEQQCLHGGILEHIPCIYPPWESRQNNTEMFQKSKCLAYCVNTDTNKDCIHIDTNQDTGTDINKDTDTEIYLESQSFKEDIISKQIS